jgi:hypothetical protein
MPDQRVFNASPSIVLGKVNLLSLLEELWDRCQALTFDIVEPIAQMKAQAN